MEGKREGNKEWNREKGKMNGKDYQGERTMNAVRWKKG